MQLIISPAKRMQDDPYGLEADGLPVFIQEADRLRAFLRDLPYEALRALLGCNEEIAQRSWQQYQRMDLFKAQTPALLAYQGIQYQYMAPQVFDVESLEYLEERLWILSGLYGALRPMDAVVPYRLELDTKLCTPFCRNLYDYWGDRPASKVTEEDDTVLDLASKEYSRIVRLHLPKGTRVIRCVFGELRQDKVVEKGVHVKMARGEMVRFLAEVKAQAPSDLMGFERLGFHYDRSRSTKREIVFLREPGNIPVRT